MALLADKHLNRFADGDLWRELQMGFDATKIDGRRSSTQYRGAFVAATKCRVGLAYVHENKEPLDIIQCQGLVAGNRISSQTRSKKNAGSSTKSRWAEGKLTAKP